MIFAKQISKCPTFRSFWGVLWSEGPLGDVWIFSFVLWRPQQFSQSLLQPAHRAALRGHALLENVPGGRWQREMEIFYQQKMEWYLLVAKHGSNFPSSNWPSAPWPLWRSQPWNTPFGATTNPVRRIWSLENQNKPQTKGLYNQSILEDPTEKRK